MISRCCCVSSSLESKTRPQLQAKREIRCPGPNNCFQDTREAMILERLFSVTPPSTRRAARRLKYYLMGNMSSSSYWNMAARISAKAAIYTDCVDDQQFFESGKREANLARRKGVLGPN